MRRQSGRQSFMSIHLTTTSEKLDLGYLRTGHAAHYLGIGKSTLERKRIEGNGPLFRVLGSRIIVYAVKDLDAWASSQVLMSTSEKPRS
jgi:predicted DNA-binding transcriptional regulator AlpA